MMAPLSARAIAAEYNAILLHTLLTLKHLHVRLRSCAYLHPVVALSLSHLVLAVDKNSQL